MHILRLSVMPLYQHYFPADDERLFGEDGAMRVKSYRVESYRIESYRVESGTTKKGTKKESFEDFSSKLSKIKEGGDLLSRIALQYHRRRRA